MASIPRCKPYSLNMPIQAKKQYLIFDSQSPKGRLTVKEGQITDARHLLDF